jgi:hypothetical protein
MLYVLVTMIAATSPTPCSRLFQHAFNLLIERVQTCIRHATQRAAEPTATPQHLRAPARATATFEWILALARCLAGDSYYRLTSCLPRRTRRATSPSSKPGKTHGKSLSIRDTLRRLGFLPPKPKHTEESRALARLNYMRKVFATQPTGVIAARLAGRAGIRKDSDYWPLDLIVITQTPAQWADDNPPGPDPRDEDPCDEPTQPARAGHSGPTAQSEPAGPPPPDAMRIKPPRDGPSG